MLDLQVKNSLMDDAKLPKIKVSGSLPKLKLSLSDKKLKQVLKIIQSLPLPPPSLASKPETSKYSYDSSVRFNVNTEGLLSTMPAPLLPATTEGDSSDDEVWYTAEEGSFDESTGSYVCSAKEEDASKKTISANKLDLTFSIPEIMINFSEHDEQSQKDTSRLSLTVTSVSTSVQHRTWDTGVTASIGSLIVDDHYNMGVVREEPQHMLSTIASEETKKTAFLSVKYNKADSTGPQFQSLFASTQQSIDVSLSLLRLQLHRESLINLLAIAQDITNDSKSKAKTKDKLSSPSGTKVSSKSQTKLDETTVAASKSVARVPGEKDLDLAATLTGIELILSDDNGNLLTSNIKGVETSVVIEEKAINISASLSDVCLVDADPGSRHPNVIVKMDKSEKVISTNVVVYKNAPKTDLNTANLSVKAKVQRLKVTILFRFLNKIKGFVSEFLTQLKLDQKTIDSAKEAAAKTATRTAEALREQSSSRVRLDITVFAPVLVLPLSALSQAAFIADLGRLKVKNNFLHADSIYEGTEDFDKGSLVSASGEKALLDKMEVSLSSIQLGRVERLKEETKPSPGHMIVEPLEFSGVVTRSLSSWCTVVPAVDVQANLQTLNLRFSPEDYHVTMSLLSSLNEGASTRPPPISPKEKDTQPEPEESLDLQPTKEVDVAEGGVNIRVTAVVGTVELALHTKGETVATVRVEELVTNVELLSNTIQVKVGISDVNVSSLNSDHLYPKIVSVTGSTKALEAKIGIYPQATKSLEGYLDTNQCDVSVEASVGQLRLVLLFLFVSKITNFLKELQVSQEAIDRAKKSAQESATAAINAVQEKQASGQRIKLSITLKAPEIVVPLHSNSGEVIVADLGVLRLSNSFHLVGGWSGGERPPLYEEYDIQLKDLQVYRTLVGVANNPPRSPVLEPFNLSLVMKRNLSISWYTDMPTIDLDASLGNLKMSASDADIEALCQVLTGNLRESLDHTPTTPTKNETPADAVEGSSLPKPAEGVKRHASVETEDTKTSSQVFKMLVLKATLKSIEIELFKSQKDSDKWVKGNHNSFASLDLHQFSSTVCIESNGAVGVAVEMLNACLEDSRSMPNKKLIRLIDKVMEDEGSTVPLVSVSFNITSNGDSFVDCTVESAKVLVDVVFIFLLLDYFKTSVSSLSKPTESSTTQKLPSPLISDAVFSETIDSGCQESIKSPSLKSPSPTPEPIEEATKISSDDKPLGTLSVKVKVLRPLIALLKNSEQKNTRALVLGSTVDFSMEQGPTGMTLKTEISELAIFATRVSNLRNTATKVLEVKNSKPIKFGMQQSTSEGTAIDIEVPDVVLSFSPTTVRLILHVVKALPVTAKDSDVEIGETSPLDLWETRPVDSSSWYLNPPVPSRNVEGTSVDQAMPLEEVFDVDEKLSLVIDSLLVLVEEETVAGGNPFPVISMKMGNYTQSNAKAMELTATNWSTELNVLSTVSMEVSYFNLGHNVWEPLLEPSVDPSYENQEVYIPWTLKASIWKDLSVTSVDKGNSRSSSVSSRIGSRRSMSSTSSVTTQPGKQDELPPEISVEIMSETPLLLTLTKSCLMLFKDLWIAYGEVEQEVTEDVDSMAPEAMEAVFVIKNELGLNYPLTVYTKDTLKVHGAYSSTVRHGRSVPLHPMTEALQLKPGEYLPREVYKKRRVHIVTIAIPSFKPIDVALGTSECVYYPLILADKNSSKKAKDSPQFGVVIDIKMSQRVPEVRIRSPLQVVNNLSEEVQVFWRKDSSEPLPPTPLTTLPGGSTHSLPLETTGSPDGGFHLNPVSSGTVPSKHSISWVNKEKSFDLGCYSSSRGYPFFMHVVIDEERYSRQPSINIASRAHHAFVLNYPLVLQNLLPLSVTVTEKTDSTVSKELPPGSKTNYSHVALSEEPRFHTKIDYNGRIWSGEVCLDEESDEYTQLTLKPEYSVDKGGEKDKNEEETSCLKLMIHVQEMGSWQLTLYCPYWIVNKTGLMLEYAGKSTDVVTVHHPQLPMALFPYKEVKVRVRGSSLQNSDWSKAFSLDAAGSEGVFRCLDKKSKQEYQMGTTVTTSSVGLSKVITISPLFMTFNQTRDEISFKVGEDLQIYTVKSKQLLVFWPKSNSEQMSLSVNDQKMSNPSKAFKFTENSSRLIQTNDLIPAVVTEIQVTGSANVVTFSPYYEGVVPVKIVNSMAYDMEFKQTAEHIKGTQTIPAGQSVFYSWRAPLVQKKAISWRIVYPAQRLKMKSILTKDDGGKFKIPSKLLPHSESTTSLYSLSGDTQGSVSDWEDSVDFPEWEELSADDEDGNLSGIEEDDEGEDEEGKDLTDFSVKHGLGVIGRGFTSTKKKLFQRRSKSRGKTVGYWVSFLDGLQRVILFTTSHEVWSHVMGGQKTERASTELFSLSLREVGLSLVNDERGLEVAYIGIRPSKPIWEILKRWNRWKPVSNHLRKHLEKIIEKPKEEIEGKVIPVPESNYKIDFSAESSWMLVEKNGTRIHVRRSHFEGVFVQVTLSEHLTSIETKINEIQIDNHLLFTSNPIILFAYPTPPTIASKYEPKPFIESSMILRNSAQSNVKQVQLFQVLIQEIGLNVDMNFILAIADLLANLPSGVTEIEGIERDLSISKFPLEKSKVEQVSAAATRNYFKFLHLSPLAIHLSFYLDRDASYKPDEHKDSSSNSVFGAVLNAFTQFAFLVGRTKDAELRLGYFELDEVALTQTGLLSRIQKHYTQQAVLQLYSVVLGLEVLGNPVGFVKGLKDGTINLFYHPIQGAVLGPGEFFEGLALGGREFFSSTIGGLSGALGKVSGAIGDIAAKMTGDDEFQEDRRRSDTWGQSLEGAAKGFVSGLTGVITQPYKGAKKEGAWGAIKGFSKGIVGVVLRPTAGILDLTSATFNAVQKKSKAGDSTVAEIRAARYIGPERIVFPYSPRRSTGYALFVDIDNGRLLETDTYFDHVELIDNPLKVLLITSRQLAVVKMSSIRGRFDDDYTVDFTEFTGPARIDEKHNSVVVMPVREETFAGLRFISGKKNYKEFDKTLAVLNEGIAKKSVELINQAYEEFRATAAIDY
ncbi:intermembrane lipid transfer protein VPS13C-like isoform X3 [Halichondria panicea]